VGIKGRKVGKGFLPSNCLHYSNITRKIIIGAKRSREGKEGLDNPYCKKGGGAEFSRENEQE